MSKLNCLKITTYTEMNNSNKYQISTVVQHIVSFRLTNFRNNMRQSRNKMINIYNCLSLSHRPNNYMYSSTLGPFC